MLHTGAVTNHKAAVLCKLHVVDETNFSCSVSPTTTKLFDIDFVCRYPRNIMLQCLMLWLISCSDTCYHSIGAVTRKQVSYILS